MADPKKDVLKALAILESTYQNLRKVAQAQISILAKSGARCTELREYNLLMMSTYNSQAAFLEILRSQGVTAPELPPFPTLFAMQGYSGQDALNIDCNKLPKFVGPTHIRVITSDSQLMVSEVPAFKQFTVPGLGLVFEILAVAGIVIAVYGAHAWVDTAKEATKQKIADLESVHERSETAKKIAELRKESLDRCWNRIDFSDPALVSACATSVDKAIPRLPDDYYSDGRPKYTSGIWGSLGTLAITIAVVVGGIAIYKRVKRRRSGGDVNVNIETDDDDDEEPPRLRPAVRTHGRAIRRA
jgi:hypothetical protein